MKTVTLIGLGRVGSHLLRIFSQNSIPVREVLARKTDDRIELSEQYNVKLVSGFNELSAGSDIYILAVPDLAIKSAAEELNRYIGKDHLVVHTSGTTPLSVLSEYFNRFGLWYPLQSFSLGSEVNWTGLPIFIDASSEEDFRKLFDLARIVSGKAIKINEDQRPYLHLAAVIANNFSNALFSWSKQILDDNGLSFEYLHPLIKDGLDKSLKIGPYNAQTGPADRGDMNTINKHLEMLKNDPDQRQLYYLLSKLINPDIQV